MSPHQLLVLLFAVSLFVGLIGFVRTVWFISIGYAASIVVFAAITGFAFVQTITWLTVAQLLAATVWGVRLGSFLSAREKSASYRAAVRDQTDDSQALPLVAKLGIWVAVSLLYVCMFSPVVFLAAAALAMDGQGSYLAWAGILVMWLGLAIEALADHQKSRIKAATPAAFANSGLYRWVRYPNYLGEILFWLGNFVAGLAAYSAWWHWLLALTGLVCITLIMMGSTKRLEVKQDSRYGADPAYVEYVRTVPVLVPWVPLYSLKGIRVYLE